MLVSLQMKQDAQGWGDEKRERDGERQECDMVGLMTKKRHKMTSVKVKRG